MDLLTHAVVGAATSWSVPAVVGSVLPDLPQLFLKRTSEPSDWYKLTHSLPFAWICYMGHPMLGVGVFSHIMLDCLTHGRRWSPFLLYPIKWQPFGGMFSEWEFFNRAWKFGLGVSLCYVAIRIGCLL